MSVSTPPTDAKPDRIADLAAFVAGRIPALFAEAHDDILAMINTTVEHAQANEGVKPILSIPLSVKWDLNGIAIVVRVGTNVKKNWEASGNLDDPRQPKLALDSGPSVTISTGGHSVTVDANSAFERVSRMTKQDDDEGGAS